MKRVVFIAPSYPPRMFVTMEATPISLAEPVARSIAFDEEQVKIPNFYEGDYDGRVLAESIMRVINSVHRDTGRAPICVDVGRFTFLEFLAHSENRLGKELPGVSFEDGIVARFYGTAIRMSPGPDHFLRGVPIACWTMMHGSPERFYVAPEDVHFAAAEAIVKALRSVPPKG